MALSPWYLEGEPQVDTGLVYINAFWNLCSERQFGQCVGPIPWSAIQYYGKELGLNHMMLRIFNLIIRELDAEYDRYQKREQGKRIREREPSDKKPKREQI